MRKFIILSFIIVAHLVQVAPARALQQWVSMAATACVDDSTSSSNIYHNWLGGAYNMSASADYFTCGYVRPNLTGNPLCGGGDTCEMSTNYVYVLDGRDDAYVRCWSLTAEHNGSYTQSAAVDTSTAYVGYYTLTLPTHSYKGVATKYMVRCLLPANTASNYSGIIAFRGYIH